MKSLIRSLVVQVYQLLTKDSVPLPTTRSDSSYKELVELLQDAKDSLDAVQRQLSVTFGSGQKRAAQPGEKYPAKRLKATYLPL